MFLVGTSEGEGTATWYFDFEVKLAVRNRVVKLAV
jgi:hypothetical protein